MTHSSRLSLAGLLAGLSLLLVACGGELAPDADTSPPSSPSPASLGPLSAFYSGPGLTARCLNAPLATNAAGLLDITVVEAVYPSQGTPPEPATLADCQRCARPGRRPLDPRLAERLRLPRETDPFLDLRDASDFACLCEIVQLGGQARTDSLLQAPPQADHVSLDEAAPDELTGWTYLDVARASSDQQRQSTIDLLATCPSYAKDQGILFPHAFPQDLPVGGSEGMTAVFFYPSPALLSCLALALPRPSPLGWRPLAVVVIPDIGDAGQEG